MGTGFQTSFWEDSWLGTPLKVRLSGLFSISQVQKETISEVERWKDGRFVLDFRWRRSFFIREEPLVSTFSWSSESFSLVGESDRWIWSHYKDGIFSMTSPYQVLHDLRHGSDPSLVKDFPSLSLIWDSWAPFKVVVFSWQLLLDRFLPRDNLFNRRIIVDPYVTSCGSIGYLFHPLWGLDSIWPSLVCYLFSVL